MTIPLSLSRHAYGNSYGRRISTSTSTTLEKLEQEPKSFARRDFLIDIEKQVQQRWNEYHVFERDAPEDFDPKTMSKDKYFVTFPYPYMNGKLHLGHGFSFSKTEFATRYQKLLGKDAMWAFSYHCTGMPIVASANKIKYEMEKYGNPPDFSHATETARHQWEIMKDMGFSDQEIEQFADPIRWLRYFPPLALRDLKRIGAAVDHRRGFITTDINPFYDSFVRWQFLTLQEKGKLSFGNRYSIFSPLDKQMCADHDRASGEGVKPKDYTIVKLKVMEPLPEVLKPLAREGRSFYLAASTLRPETMYGQTNCWLLPEGEYGAFEIAQDGNDVLVMTERSAYNLAFQGFSKEVGKTSCLAKFTGQDLMGAALSAPRSSFEKIHVLPLLTVDMKKTTGVVTSVPSDSPDDYAAMMDLKNKDKLREKFGIKDDWVLPYEVVPIIDIEGYGDTIAPTLYSKMKIKSQNDAQKLTEAKDIAYKEGFNSGKLIVGNHAGKIVKDVKDIIRDELIAENLAIPYSEPENEVISRSGDKCVVALTPQWYISYGEENWRKSLETYLKETFHTYNPQTYKELMDTIGWLKEWGCSRSFGLGTRLPGDEQYLIESLSDSTIYMAYYTISHLLQEGELDGSKGNSLGIKPEMLTKPVWDYIFLSDAVFPEECTISKEKVDKLRREFHYWYPVDLRASGKDLIKNHLTMFLYNHAAIWDKEQDKWPRSIFANGWVMVNGEKMSKSAGNFHTIEDICEMYGADAVRVALADSGDTHDDANFEESTANATVLRMYNHVKWVEEMLQAQKDGKLRSSSDTIFQDRVFESKINKAIKEAKQYYGNMMYKEALRVVFFDYEIARDEYRLECSEHGFAMREDLVMKFIEFGTVMLSPICPHMCDHIWTQILKKSDRTVYEAHWPEQTSLGIDVKALEEHSYMHSAMHGFRQKLQKDQKRKAFTVEGAYIYVADQYLPWQKDVLAVLRDLHTKGEKFDNMGVVAKLLKGIIKEKKLMSTAMAFVAQMNTAYVKNGEEALNDELIVNEREVFERNRRFIEQQLNIPEGQLHIYASSMSDIPDPQNRLRLVSPLKPQITFVEGSSSSK